MPMPTGVGPGLRNLGDTCFLNATMQCLTHTVPFLHGLAEMNHPNPCDRAMEGFCVFCALRDHMIRAMCSSGGVMEPIKLVENINLIGPYFEEGQQDAHEFQHALLDRLESCCYSDQAMDGNTPAGSNMVDRVFGGRLVSEVRCCECGHRTRTFETFIDLSLEIERAGTLHAALECFTEVEKMDDFRCVNCNQKVTIEKHFLLEKKPMIAALHLKRFKSDGFNVKKIDKHVGFPLELDLQPFSSGSKNGNMELKYYLYAVVVHAGISPTSGHYYSFIRSSPNTWHGFNDARVCEVSQEEVLSESAYILFYAREDVPWFSSIMDIANVAPSPTFYWLMKAPVPLLCTISGFELCRMIHRQLGQVTSLMEPLALMQKVLSHLSARFILGIRKIIMETWICLSHISLKVILTNRKMIMGNRICFRLLHRPSLAALNMPMLLVESPQWEILEPWSMMWRNPLPCKRKLNEELQDSNRRETVRNIKGML